MRRLVSLIGSDVRNVARDPLLAYLPLIPFLLLLGLRLAIPWLTGLLAPSFALEPYYVFIVGFLLLMTPLLVGMVAGFILLDERDDNILAAISVTPMSKAGFLLYRLTAPTVLSFLLGILLAAAIGLVPLRLLRLIPLALLASLEAPMLALFMAAFAGNKVEGLVLAKGSGLMFLAPLVLVFLPAGWHLAAGVLPTYWVTRCFLAIYEPGYGYWISLAAGAGVHELLLLVLLRRFTRRME